MEPQQIIWAGQSGAQYTYWIYPIGTTFQSVPGNYIFARLTPEGWHAIYAGETGDLSRRFANHHQQECIDRNAATHIHARKNQNGEQARRNEEADIRARWNPPCNRQ